VEDLVLEEVPNITYADIGAWRRRSTKSAMRSSCRCCTPALRAHKLSPRRASCSTAAGCGKTLIAKAVANALASSSASKRTASKAYFLNVKGPELLNKYVARPNERSARSSSGRGRRPAPAHRW